MVSGDRCSSAARFRSVLPRVGAKHSPALISASDLVSRGNSTFIAPMGITNRADTPPPSRSCAHLCGHFSPSQRQGSHQTRRNEAIQKGGPGRRDAEDFSPTVEIQYLASYTKQTPGSVDHPPFARGGITRRGGLPGRRLGGQPLPIVARAIDLNLAGRVTGGFCRTPAARLGGSGPLRLWHSTDRLAAATRFFANWK
jgi:hypothetical protein